jgi:hypothetical protein
VAYALAENAILCTPTGRYRRTSKQEQDYRTIVAKRPDVNVSGHNIVNIGGGQPVAQFSPIFAQLKHRLSLTWTIPRWHLLCSGLDV